MTKKNQPCLLGTPRTYTMDPFIKDSHLATAVRQLSDERDLSLIYHTAAILAAKEESNVEHVAKS